MPLTGRRPRSDRFSKYSSMTSSSRSERLAPPTGSASKSPLDLVAASWRMASPPSGRFSGPWRRRTRPSARLCNSGLRETLICTTVPRGNSSWPHSVATGGRHSPKARDNTASTSSLSTPPVTSPSKVIPIKMVPPSALAKATNVSARISTSGSGKNAVV